MSAPRVITFGCRLNAYESEILRRNAAEAGLADAIIVNSCAVTAEAERQVRQSIRRARRENPDSEIIVTGCAAQIDPETYAAMPEVNRVLGNEEKLRPENFFPDQGPAVLVNDIMSVEETAGHLMDGFVERSRAFVQIQQGCDHRCTFCVIPQGRGNSRSVPLGALVRQIRSLLDQGLKEIVLTGVDITSYGRDLPGSPSLGQMLRRLMEQVPELERLRLSSLDAIEMDPDLLDLIGCSEILMPHLHLSLQSGDDMILKRMKRRHGRGQAVALCREILARRPDMVLGADLIAGFPTESEEMFESTLRLLDDCSLTYLHVFPYSARPGTPAARMPQVPVPVRKERAAKLRARGAERRAAFFRSRIGGNARVLLEKPDFGHTEDFAPLRLIPKLAAARVPQPAAGHVLEVQVTAADDGGLVGQAID
jgi:threonylcarbamoyladenosine tRNA methylthiotransferase MtaB